MTAEATTLSVHRCRFVDFTPSAVTALAFPPLPLPSAKGKKSAVVRKALKFGTLAVGRANGNIELCEWTGTEQRLEAPQAWVVNKVSRFHMAVSIRVLRINDESRLYVGHTRQRSTLLRSLCGIQTVPQTRHLHCQTSAFSVLAEATNWLNGT